MSDNPSSSSPDPLPEFNVEIDLLDSERAIILEVYRHLQATSEGKHRTIDGFVREAMDRYHDAGFYVDVRMFSDEGYLGPESERVWYPKIVVVGKVEGKAEFDHDQMGHEVRSDILGLRGGDDRQNISVAPGFSSTKPEQADKPG